MLTNALQFLQNLKANNNKDWMQENKPAYQQAKEEYLQIIQSVIDVLSTVDEGLIGLTAKESVFRINRDIRFSKDKAPYKLNFGAFICEGGRKSGNAGYYFHLQPGGNSFLAGGVYGPSKERLDKIRQEIDYNPEELKEITSDKTFKAYFDRIQGDSLKRPPKGYDADHPNIDLIKLKSFMVLTHFDDKTIEGWKDIDSIVEVFKEIKPFNDYLNVAMS